MWVDLAEVAGKMAEEYIFNIPDDAAQSAESKV